MKHASLLLAFCLACGTAAPAEKPYVKDYDTSCDVVEDCQAVILRGHCNCSCDRWAGINKSDAQAFVDAQQSYYASYTCDGHCLLGCLPIAEESQVTLACEEGTCRADAPVGGTGYY